MYLTNPDLRYADAYGGERQSGQFPFFLSLQANLSAAYQGMRADHIEYGKPSRLTFEFAETVLREQAAKHGVDISEIYMIGDNPSGDITGANRMGAGWNSILVHSGVYKPEDRPNLQGDQIPTFEAKNM